MNKQSLIYFLLFINSLGAQNLIKNSSFEEEDNHWELIIKKPKESKVIRAEMKVSKLTGHDDKQCLKIRVISANKNKTSQGINLIQKIKGIKKNRKYELTMWVKSSMIEEDHISYSISSYNIEKPVERRYGKYAAGKLKYKGDNQWKKVSTVFDTSSKNVTGYIDLDNLQIKISLGHRIGTFYLDDISLKQI